MPLCLSMCRGINYVDAAPLTDTGGAPAAAERRGTQFATAVDAIRSSQQPVGR